MRQVICKARHEKSESKLVQEASLTIIFLQLFGTHPASSLHLLLFWTLFQSGIICLSTTFFSQNLIGWSPQIELVNTSPYWRIPFLKAWSIKSFLLQLILKGSKVIVKWLLLDVRNRHKTEFSNARSSHILTFEICNLFSEVEGITQILPCSNIDLEIGCFNMGHH